MKMTNILALASLMALGGCRGKSETVQPAADEPPPWEFPGEEVAPEDIPKNVVVEMSQPSIEGSLTDDTVRGALRPQLEDLAMCYGVRLARHCKIKGEMRMSLDVARNGKIFGMQVLSDTTRDTRLGDCVSRVVRKATFGETEQETKITVTYTFEPPADVPCE